MNHSIHIIHIKPIQVIPQLLDSNSSNTVYTRSLRSLPLLPTLITCFFLSLALLPYLHAVTTSIYAPYNGVGNNVAHPRWGAAESNYIRATAPAAYVDGISVPYGSTNTPLLPSPRKVSATLFSLPSKYTTYQLSSLKLAWGQLVAHDVGMGKGGDEAFNVDVPCCDAVMDKTCTCNQIHPFTRLISDNTTGASLLNPRSPVNFQTAFLDASATYGTSFNRITQIRTFHGGKLKSDPINGVPLNTDAYEMEQGGHGAPLSKQRLVGDVRGNSNPGLLPLHGLMNLEHNRWCDVLHDANPTWKDEQLFQEARKRVMALYQIVTYNEYLPSLIGESLPSWTAYKSETNPGIDTFFAMGAYRYGHSGINSIYMRLTPNMTAIHEGHLLLRDSFFNPAYLKDGGIASLIRGMIIHPEASIDTILIDDLRNFVHGFLADLAAIDIQRGRDVGLPFYNNARRYYGLKPVTTFDEISSDPAVVKGLSSLYSSVEYVDAWVGGLCEMPVNGGSVGPLFAKAIKEQFLRTRDGDRFWYENVFPSGEQLDELRKTRLSDIIKRNLPGMELIPDNVFYLPPDVTCAPPAPTYYPDDENAYIPLDERLSISWKMVDIGYNASISNVTHTFTLYNVTSTRIRITIRGITSGWVAIGFGHSMINSELLIGRVVNGVPELYQYETRTHTMPTPIASEGKQSPVTLITGKEEQGVTYIVFERELCVNGFVTIDSGPQNVIYAYQEDDGLVYHGRSNRGSGTVDFSVEPGPLNEYNKRNRNFRLFVVHGVGMIILWGVIAPIGLFAVRFFKTNAFWWPFHKACMMVVSIGTLFFGALPILGSETSGYVSTIHFILGMTLIIFVGIQNSLGHIVKYLLAIENVMSESIRVWMTVSVHRWLGRAMIPLAWVNGVFGLMLISGTGGYIYIYIFVPVWGTFILSVLSYLSIRRLKQYQTPPDAVKEGPHIAYSIKKKQEEREANDTSATEIPDETGTTAAVTPIDTNDEDAILHGGVMKTSPISKSRAHSRSRLTPVDAAITVTPKWSLREVLSKVQAGGKLIIYKGAIYDVTNYVANESHPGGTYIISSMYGRDVTPFFTGKQRITGRQHTHSLAALDLLRTMCVAQMMTMEEEMAQQKHAQKERSIRRRTSSMRRGTSPETRAASTTNAASVYTTQRTTVRDPATVHTIATTQAMTSHIARPMNASLLDTGRTLTVDRNREASVSGASSFGLTSDLRVSYMNVPGQLNIEKSQSSIPHGLASPSSIPSHVHLVKVNLIPPTPVNTMPRHLIHTASIGTTTDTAATSMPGESQQSPTHGQSSMNETPAGAVEGGVSSAQIDTVGSESGVSTSPTHRGPPKVSYPFAAANKRDMSTIMEVSASLTSMDAFDTNRSLPPTPSHAPSSIIDTNLQTRRLMEAAEPVFEGDESEGAEGNVADSESSSAPVATAASAAAASLHRPLAAPSPSISRRNSTGGDTSDDTLLFAGGVVDEPASAPSATIDESKNHVIPVPKDQAKDEDDTAQWQLIEREIMIPESDVVQNPVGRFRFAQIKRNTASLRVLQEKEAKLKAEQQLKRSSSDVASSSGSDVKEKIDTTTGGTLTLTGGAAASNATPSTSNTASPAAAGSPATSPPPRKKPITFGNHYSICIPKYGLTLSRPYTVVNVHNAQREDTIELWVKAYPSGRMSKYIHELALGDRVFLQGPTTGKIRANALRGNGTQQHTVLLVGGGTGILTFFDLIGQICNTATPSHVPPSDPVERFPNLSLILIGSFANEKEVIAYDWLQECARVDPRFELVLYVQKKHAGGKRWNGPTGHISSAVMQQLFDIKEKENKPITHVFVSGPPRFEFELADLFAQLGIEGVDTC